MKKFMLILPLVVGLATAGSTMAESIPADSIMAVNSGKNLFEKKCSNCHSMGTPINKSKMVAPPARGIVVHLKMAHPKKDDFTKFLVDYVVNPSKDKALCQKETIERFGVMPSQKGVVTEEELKKISEFLFDNYVQGNPQKMHQKMMQEMQGAGQN